MRRWKKASEAISDLSGARVGCAKMAYQRDDIVKFYAPYTDSKEQAEKLWVSVRRYLTQQGFSTTERRIRKVYFRHKGQEYEAEVGKLFREIQEETIFIVEAAHRRLIYLCTPHRGVVRGDPYLVDARDSGTFIVDFDRA